MVNWSSPDIVKWKKEATILQQGLCDKLSDRVWDHIKVDERWALEKKVGFALFGDPSVFCVDRKTPGYERDQTKEIHRICHLIYEKSGGGNVFVAFLFIFGKVYEHRFCVPIIKVRVDSTAVFIDSLGRTYQDWSDFKANNKLPKSLLCYPCDGLYKSTDQNDVLLEFSTSPACHAGAKVINALDKVTSGVGLVATGVVLFGSAFTVAAPLAIASTIGLTVSGAYGLFRGSQNLYDRGIHDQTISPVDSEARNCWITVLGGAFGVGSSVAVSRAVAVAARGGMLSRTSTYIINFLNFGSLTVNGIGIANGLAYLVERKQKGELNSLEVFQWTASLFFFYNAAVNIKTAKGIVRDIQEGIMSDISADLSKRRKHALKRFTKETMAEGGGKMEGNARLIKGISNIGSKDEFFRLVIKGQNKYDKGIKFNESGFLETKGQIFCDTKAGIDYPIAYNTGENFFKIPDKCISRLARETMSLMENVKSDTQRDYIRVNENLKFELNSDLVERLSQVFSRYYDFGDDESAKKKEMGALFSQSEKFSQDRDCKTLETYLSYYEFIALYKKSRFEKMRKSYEGDKTKLKASLGDDFDEDEFNKCWNIEDPGNIREAFLSMINKEIESTNDDLLKEYDKYNKDITLLNESGNVKFRSCANALIHFYRCFLLEDDKLTLQEYFTHIRRTVENEENTRIELKAGDKNCMKYLYYDNRVPVTVIVLETSDGKYLEETDYQEYNPADWVNEIL